MLSALMTQFLPNKVMLFRPTEVESPEITGIAAFTVDQLSLEGKATAYVCRNYACNRPTTDRGEMLKLVKGE
jgi:uncharacterized protein YyaL (SSP411 family)